MLWGLFLSFKIRKIGRSIKYLVSLTPQFIALKYPITLTILFPTHQNFLDLCIGGIDKKGTYKPQHDSVNYSFNVDTRNLCNVSQQASNQATWKTSPTRRSPIFNKQDTLSTHTSDLQKEQSKTRTMQTKGLSIQYMIYAYSSDTIFFPGDQYRKTVAPAAHRTEI